MMASLERARSMWNLRECLGSHASNSVFFRMDRTNICRSAGGGGKTRARQDKILDKNNKLKEERARKSQADKEKEAVKKGSKENEQGGIHPSRRHNITAE